MDRQREKEINRDATRTYFFVSYDLPLDVIDLSVIASYLGNRLRWVWQKNILTNPNSSEIMIPFKMNKASTIVVLLAFYLTLVSTSLSDGDNVKGKNINLGLEPWSSGYGRRLMFWRSWVRIPAPYTGWTFFTLICWKIVLMFAWKRP